MKRDPIIIHIENPFEPFDAKMEKAMLDEVVADFIRMYNNGSDEFPVPTLVLLNGEPLKRDEWGYQLRQNDVLTFVTLPGDAITIIVLVVAVVVAVAVALLLVPEVPGELGDSDPAYSLKGQQNRTRVGEPIEVCYGKVISFPSYAARPYNQYISNDQFQYSLFCVGQGQYEIHDVLIEDTPLSEFDEVEYEVVGPGGTISLFPDNVITSVEIDNVELLGSNESGYPIDGWFGPFVANAAGTLASKLEFDITFQQGLYRLDEGKRKSFSVTYEIQYREIDDDGVSQGSFQTAGTFAISRATGTPQRTTHIVEVVSPGRFECRVRRVGTASDSAEVMDTCTWEAMRAFLPSTKNYGNVTMLATKIKATNQLNSNNRSRIRVDKTRKLRQWNGTSWTAETPTRSPIWAMVDILQAQYGGRLPDSFLRLNDLKTMADEMEARGDYFDFIFDRRSTAWNGCKTAMRVARSIPMLFGSQISAVRDGPKTQIQGVFNRRNIIPGSFRLDIRLTDSIDYDHVVVEYTDAADGLPAEVICRLPDDGVDYPEHLKMPGITSRAQAYREGMFYRATRRYQRETCTFKTGMEGYIPAWGDLVRIEYDIPKWGHGGHIIDYDQTEKKLVLSDPVGLLIPNTVNGDNLTQKSGVVSSQSSTYQSSSSSDKAIDDDTTIGTEIKLGQVGTSTTDRNNVQFSPVVNQTTGTTWEVDCNFKIDPDGNGGTINLVNGPNNDDWQIFVDPTSNIVFVSIYDISADNYSIQFFSGATFDLTGATSHNVNVVGDSTNVTVEVDETILGTATNPNADNGLPTWSQMGKLQTVYGQSFILESIVFKIDDVPVRSYDLSAFKRRNGTTIPAVESNTDSMLIQGERTFSSAESNISITQNEEFAWWQVDLGSTKLVREIVLWNRTDNYGNLLFRLANYRISLIDDLGGVVCYEDFHTGGTHTGENEIWTLPRPMYGRTVKIEYLGWINGVTDQNYLSLTEVQIFEAEIYFDKRKNYIAFRGKDGSQVGNLQELDPLKFQSTPDFPGSTNQIVDKRIVYLVEELPTEIVDELNLTNPDKERSYFVIGVGDDVGKEMKVSNIEPADDGQVEVTCVTYSPRAFSYDDTPPPVEDSVTLPPQTPTAPSVAGLRVVAVPDDDERITVSWFPSAGAIRYRLEQSETGTAGTWTLVSESPGTSKVMAIKPGDLYLRVAALNDSYGPWQTWNGEVGIPTNPPAAPTLAANSQDDWAGLVISAAWEPFPVAGAQSFKARIYDTTDLTPGNEIAEISTSNLQASYSADDMDGDLGPNNTVRDVTIAVVAVNPGGTSAETQRRLINASPAQITSGLTSIYDSDNATHALYNVQWTYTTPLDFKEYQVHGSATQGFTPTAATLLATSATNTAQIQVPLTAPPASAHDAFYWRVVAIDRFGNDVTIAENVNFSDQQTIASKP